MGRKRNVQNGGTLTLDLSIALGTFPSTQPHKNRALESTPYTVAIRAMENTLKSLHYEYILYL